MAGICSPMPPISASLSRLRTPYCETTQWQADQVFKCITVAQYSPKLLFRFDSRSAWSCIDTYAKCLSCLLHETGGFMPKQLDMVKRFRAWQGEQAWALADVERAMLHFRGMIMKLSRVKRSNSRPTPPRKFMHLQFLVGMIAIKTHEAHEADAQFGRCTL